MENMDKKEETVTDLVPADQNPEETKGKDDNDTEFLRAMFSILENGITLQTDGFDFINVGKDQLVQIQLIETCLKGVENFAPKEWLSSVQKNISHIFEILNPAFSADVIEKVQEFFQAVDTQMEEAAAQGEQAAVESSYHIFRQLRDAFSETRDNNRERRSEFNQINQWISEILDKLKEQNLEEIFGDSLTTLETSLAKLQENGEIMESKSFFIEQLNDFNVKNFSIITDGFKRMRKEKYGIEGDMIQMLSITDGEKKDEAVANEEPKNNSDLGFDSELTQSAVENSKEEVKVQEEEKEDAKQEEKKIDNEFNETFK